MGIEAILAAHIAQTGKVNRGASEHTARVSETQIKLLVTRGDPGAWVREDVLYKEEWKDTEKTE